MTVVVKMRDGPVDSIQGDEPAEVLYTLYHLGVHPPISAKEFKERMGVYHTTLYALVDGGEESEEGGSQS